MKFLINISTCCARGATKKNPPGGEGCILGWYEKNNSPRSGCKLWLRTYWKICPPSQQRQSHTLIITHYHTSSNIFTHIISHHQASTHIHAHHHAISRIITQRRSSSHMVTSHHIFLHILTHHHTSAQNNQSSPFISCFKGIKHHCTLAQIIKHCTHQCTFLHISLHIVIHHHTPSNIIKHHQISIHIVTYHIFPNLIPCHHTSSQIITNTHTSPQIIARHNTLSYIITYHHTTAHIITRPKQRYHFYSPKKITLTCCITGPKLVSIFTALFQNWLTFFFLVQNNVCILILPAHNWFSF